MAWEAPCAETEQKAELWTSAVCEFGLDPAFDGTQQPHLPVLLKK